ncbi:hypothetical protein QJS10_CPA16g00634 [Acorus calamus]|uniref:Aminotransferase-like plant mobile domain-containing protein n=1 Tax=Acorus calamus TaxID=4465 RepID=A0AAV9CYL5_ACOCL|nr:hypothetical protein QJS10_CPA16g00634 [Acorus calamus]
MRELVVKDDEKSAKDFGKLFLLHIFATVLFYRSNYTCSLELVDIVEDLDNLGQYAWAKAVHIDIMKSLRRSSRNLERAGGSDALDGKGYFSGCAIALNIDFIEDERVLLPEVKEDDDNAAPETHNVLMPMPSRFYSVEDLRKGLERVLHMPMPINVVSPSTSSPNMKRKREQREQKLVSKMDMDKKVKLVPSKRTSDKVEKKKVGKRIGSIERMVKIRRRNIPKRYGKSNENQGDVAKNGPKGVGATKMKKGVTMTKVAGGAMRGAVEENKPNDHAAMGASEVEALAKVAKEVDSILDDILNIPTQEEKAEEEVSDKEKTVDEKKVEEQSMDVEVDMKEKTDDEIVPKEKTDDDDVLIEDNKCFSGPKRKRTVTLRKGPLTRSAGICF